MKAWILLDADNEDDAKIELEKILHDIAMGLSDIDTFLFDDD